MGNRARAPGHLRSQPFEPRRHLARAARALRPRARSDRRRGGGRLLVQATPTRQCGRAVPQHVSVLAHRWSERTAPQREPAAQGGLESRVFRRGQPVARRPHPGIQAGARFPLQRDRHASGSAAYPRGASDHAQRTEAATSRTCARTHRQADDCAGEGGLARIHCAGGASGPRACGRTPAAGAAGDVDRTLAGAQAARGRSSRASPNSSTDYDLSR